MQYFFVKGSRKCNKGKKSVIVVKNCKFQNIDQVVIAKCLHLNFIHYYKFRQDEQRYNKSQSIQTNKQLFIIRELLRAALWQYNWLTFKLLPSLHYFYTKFSTALILRTNCSQTGMVQYFDQLGQVGKESDNLKLIKSFKFRTSS